MFFKFSRVPGSGLFFPCLSCVLLKLYKGHGFRFLYRVLFVNVKKKEKKKKEEERIFVNNFKLVIFSESLQNGAFIGPKSYLLTNFYLPAVLFIFCYR